MDSFRWITLTEYVPLQLSHSELEDELGEIIWAEYGKQINLDFPSPKTKGNWMLTSQGWVGYIPISQDLGVSLMPKVPLATLFAMLDYAYRLNSFRFLEGFVNCSDLKDLYEKLAQELARRVLLRLHKGLYKEYKDCVEELTHVRGKVDLCYISTRPYEVKFKCEYQEHLADIKENQILAWTLFKIIGTGLCSDKSSSLVRRAYRTLTTHTGLIPFRSIECVGHTYNRLNNDYEPLHALCRFFLDYDGPSHMIGNQKMIPFIVDMARLYEMFVAEWLRVHLPLGYELKAQERIVVGNEGAVNFNIDLVIYNTTSGEVHCVLDTKYKNSWMPSPADVAQVITYAVAKNCKEAILVYPTAAINSFYEYVGEINVRSLSFDLDKDIDIAGHSFINELLWKN